MVCEPAVPSFTPVSVAMPPLSVTGVPLLSDIDVEPTVSRKLTAPVGMVDECPVAVSLTVAVNVSGCPMAAEVGLMETAVAVVAALIMPVPLTRISCVVPVTLSALLVTVMPALRLPADCGVNCTETLHAVPDVNEVLNRHWLLLPVGSEKFAVKVGFAENVSA